MSQAQPDRQTTLTDGTGPRIAERRVVAPFAPLSFKPGPRQAQETELLHGQGFDVHAEQGRYVYGRAAPLQCGSARRAYVGWVPTKALGAPGPEPTHAVSVVTAPVFSRADLKSPIVMSLPLGARIAVMAEAGGYLQIGAGAWMSRLHLRALDDPEADFIAVARRYLGQPYVWGGTGARGLDCSGLVQMSLDACGVDAPRDADMQEAVLGEPVALDAPRVRGDLLFWAGHVGIMATRTRLLHANATHMSVVEEPVGAALRRIARAGYPLRSVKRL
ncbi:MAG: NlpC/P60 family protein [Pseudomonadota bacterium]